MSRVRRFQANVKVTEELFIQGDKEAVTIAIGNQLEAQLSGPLRGPRGGRYEPLGDIEYLGSARVGDDFMLYLWTYAARRWGKYVRPLRSDHGTRPPPPEDPLKGVAGVDGSRGEPRVTA